MSETLTGKRRYRELNVTKKRLFRPNKITTLIILQVEVEIGRYDLSSMQTEYCCMWRDAKVSDMTEWVNDNVA